MKAIKNFTEILNYIWNTMLNNVLKK